MSNCECMNWGVVGMSLRTEHAPSCWKREAELGSAFRALIVGIERWAADEDGIPDHLFDAYKSARRMLLPERKFMEPSEEVT